MGKYLLSSLIGMCCIILLLPSIISAHPGRTDSNGGHVCRTNCEKWGLEYGEYHHHNGGGSKSNNSTGSSSDTSKPVPTPKSEPTPKPEPKPKIDKKQGQANKHFQQANSYYNSGDYQSAIDELEKIYKLGKNNSKTDSLVRKSLAAIYGLATSAFKKEDYSTAKEHIKYITDNQYTSDQLNQKADALLEEIKVSEEVEHLLSEATYSKDEKEYNKALEYIKEARKLKDSKALTAFYDETVEALMEDAQLAYQKREYNNALKHYKLLVKITHTPQLSGQFQNILQQIRDEQLLQDKFGISKSDFDGESLYTHLIETANKTSYDKTIVNSLKSALVESEKEQMQFIFNIEITDLLKGAN